MVDGWKVVKNYDGSYTLRQDGTRNKQVMNREKLANRVRRYWGVK